MLYQYTGFLHALIQRKSLLICKHCTFISQAGNVGGAEEVSLSQKDPWIFVPNISSPAVLPLDQMSLLQQYSDLFSIMGGNTLDSSFSIF